MTAPQRKLNGNGLPEDIAAGFLKDPGDLSHLKNITADAVRHFVDSLNACTPTILKGRKLVAVLGTGGTISMKVENGIRVPDLTFSAIFSHSNSNLSDMFHIVGLDAFRLDSSQMDYSHVRDLAIVMAHVWKNVDAPFAGFLIPHGTDTMTYAAAAMAMILGPGQPFPVVYTGAQKTIQEPMNDAGTNLRNALFTLDAMDSGRITETVIVMGDRVLLGTTAVKVSETLANAFESPMHKYVTSFLNMEYPIRLGSWLKAKDGVPFAPTIWTGDFGHSLVVHSALGLHPETVMRQAQDPHTCAVLLYAYGAGTIYEGVIDAILAPAKVRNIPVFVASPVNAEYKAMYESSQHIIDRGAIPLTMTLPAALAKTEVALRLHPGDLDALATFMATDYVGEIPSDQSRFNPILRR